MSGERPWRRCRSAPADPRLGPAPALESTNAFSSSRSLPLPNSMAVTVRIDRATGVARFTFVGELTIDNAQESLEAAYSHPDYGQPRRHLVDVRSASIYLSLEEFDAVLTLEGDGGRQGPVKTAVVAPDGPIHDAAMLLQRRAAKEEQQLVEVRPFRSLEEAEQWLVKDAPAREEDLT